MRGLYFCLIVFMVLSPAASAKEHAGAAAYQDFQTADALRAQLRSAFVKIQSNDFAGSEQIVKQVVASSAFSSLTDAEQHVANYFLGLAEFEQNQLQDALAMFKISSESPYAVGTDWFLRLTIANQLGDIDDAVTSLTRIVQQWPSTLSQINDEAIVRLASKAAKTSNDKAIALIGPLYAAKWHPRDPFQIADHLWFLLGLAYLQENQPDKAKDPIGSIADVAELVRIQIDKRFDSVTGAGKNLPDIASAIAKEIADTKRLSAASPDSLKGINTLTDLLIKTGHPPDALAILDQAMNKARSEESAKPAFSDYDENINWTFDNRSRVLFMLGRNQEALDTLTRASRKPESGGPNVSQAINLADFLNYLGRPQDALNAVADVSPRTASAYGKMALENARACAYSQIKDEANLNKSLTYLRDHQSDAMRPWLETLICTNSLDEAAHFLIAQLRDTSGRSDALFLLQNYLDVPGATATDLENRQRLIIVRNRQDVTAAVAAVGRINSYPLLPPGY